MKKLLAILLVVSCFFPFYSQAQTETTKLTETVIKPIRILIVPGHDNEVWGAEYGNLKEADMNLALATEIFNIFKKDKRFEVYITRDQNGYVKEFSDYFSKEKDNIIDFKNNAKKEALNKITNGDFITKTTVPHNAVSASTSVKLYGINKWVNENNIDVVLHVHFDDNDRGSNKWKIGPYKGFTVYYPDIQMVNAKESTKLAGDIFLKLYGKYSTSTLPKEKGGFIADQKLIALGASGTLNKSVRAVLIEYGYIYQKILRNSTTRHQAYKNMASLTVKGITNYFFKK